MCICQSVENEYETFTTLQIEAMDRTFRGLLHVQIIEIERDMDRWMRVVSAVRRR